MNSGVLPTVYIVDDDSDMREAITDLVESVGLRAESFASGEEFLSRRRTVDPSCLVLDVRLPQMSGLDFQRQLADSNIQIPSSLLQRTGIFRCLSEP
jgi:FixJ family two-component response regulator